MNELIEKILHDPLSLINDKDIYDIDFSTTGIVLMGRFTVTLNLYPSLKEFVAFDESTGHVQGTYSDDRISFRIVLT